MLTNEGDYDGGMWNPHLEGWQTDEEGKYFTPPDFLARDELVKTIRNRCTTYLLVRNYEIRHISDDLPEKVDCAPLLNTITEDIFAGAQTLLDEHCQGKLE